jgi:hypothetical protein
MEAPRIPSALIEARSCTKALPSRRLRRALRALRRARQTCAWMHDLGSGGSRLPIGVQFGGGGDGPTATGVTSRRACGGYRQSVVSCGGRKFPYLGFGSSSWHFRTWYSQRSEKIHFFCSSYGIALCHVHCRQRAKCAPKTIDLTEIDGFDQKPSISVRSTTSPMRNGRSD